MKNKLTDLNNHLFTQMERLCSEDLEGDKLALEVKRAEAIVGVADQIVRNAALQLQAAKLSIDFPRANLPALLESKPTIDAKPANGQARPQ